MPIQQDRATKETKAINKDMTFQEILTIFPDAAVIMAKNGMACIGCLMASAETISQGASAHGIDPEKLIKEINTAIKAKSAK
jgi:hybrid cluster-associated redox disulfide protein